MKITALYSRCCLSLICLVLVSGCGFHLRGLGNTADFAFSTIYIDNPKFVKTADLIKTTLLTQGIKVLAKPEGAEVVLNIYDGIYQTETLSVNANGQVSQYRLQFRLDYQIVQPLTAAAEIPITRDLDFDASQFIAKESEQRILREDMERDAGERLVRILSRLNMQALTKKTSAPDNTIAPNLPRASSTSAPSSSPSSAP